MGYPELFNELERWRDELRFAGSPKKLIRALEDRVKHEADPVRLRILKHFLAEEHIAQGRPGAAAAIRLEDPVWQMHLWYERCAMRMTRRISFQFSNRDFGQKRTR